MAEPTIKAKLILETGGGGGGSSGSSGSKSVLGGFGGLGKLTGLLTVISGAVGAISEIANVAFKSTLKVLGGILKMIGLLLKPIGDILAIGLMPLLFLIKPIARIFNILFAPYLRAAMTAFKAGQKFASEGNAGKAAESFGLGFAALVKPFFDLMLTNLNLITQALLSVIQVAFTPFIVMLGKVAEFLTGGAVKAEEFVAAFEVGFDTARETVNSFFTNIIQTTNDLLFGKIKSLAEEAGLVVDKFTTDGQVSFASLGTTITETLNTKTGEITTAIASIMGLNTTMIDDFKKQFEALKAEQVDPLIKAIGGEGGLNEKLTQLQGTIKGVGQEADSIMSKLKGYLSDASSIISSLKANAGKIAGAAVGGLVGGPAGMAIGAGVGAIVDVARKSISSSKSTKVKDAIITKDGKVIHTDPNDNIFATKNGGMGGNYNVSVNINAMDASGFNQSFINSLTKQITDKIKRETQGRSSYATGI